MYLKKFLSLNAIAIASSFASDYQKDIKPIFDKHCIICHGPTASAGGYQLHTKYKAFSKGPNGVRIVPGKADSSSVYTMCTLDKSNPKTMPPSAMPRLSKNELSILKNWINAGATWPNATKQNVEFVKTLSSVSGEREITSASKLYKALNFDKKAGQALVVDKPYTVYKGAEYEFTMMPIPAGKYKRGSDHGDESPVKEIAISSFWMGKHEVTWAEYESWQFDLDIERRTAENFTMNNLDKNADIVSRPTGPYLDMSFGMGKEKRPVICMTQLAAKAYCMWLSAKTGDFYRLPTEAE